MKAANVPVPVKSRSLALCCLAALIGTGCVSTASVRLQSGQASTTVISAISVNQPIRVPAGHTRVFMQQGKIVKRFNHYAPNCNIEVKIRDDNSDQVVVPGEYRVSKIRSTYEEVVQFSPGHNNLLAANTTTGRLADYNTLKLAFSDDSGQNSIYLGYHFQLDGIDKNVLRLSCRGAYADPAVAEPPTYPEIAAALGALITLNP